MCNVRKKNEHKIDLVVGQLVRHFQGEESSEVNIFMTPKTHAWLERQIANGGLSDFSVLLSLVTKQVLSNINMVLDKEAELLAKMGSAQVTSHDEILSKISSAVRVTSSGSFLAVLSVRSPR